MGFKFSYDQSHQKNTIFCLYNCLKDYAVPHYLIDFEQLDSKDRMICWLVHTDEVRQNIVLNQQYFGHLKMLPLIVGTSTWDKYHSNAAIKQQQLCQSGNRQPIQFFRSLSEKYNSVAQQVIPEEKQILIFIFQATRQC